MKDIELLDIEMVGPIDKMEALRYIMNHIDKVCSLANCPIKKTGLTMYGNEIQLNLVIDWLPEKE